MSKTKEEGVRMDDRGQRAAASIEEAEDRWAASMIYASNYPELPSCPVCKSIPQIHEDESTRDGHYTLVFVECPSCDYRTPLISFNTLTYEDAQNASTGKLRNHYSRRVNKIHEAANLWLDHCMQLYRDLIRSKSEKELEKFGRIEDIPPPKNEFVSTDSTWKGGGVHLTEEIPPGGDRVPPPKKSCEKSPTPKIVHAPTFNELIQQITKLLWATLPPTTTLSEANELASEIYDRISALWVVEADR